MVVNIGSLSFTDDELKAIAKAAGVKGRAKRDDVKRWAIDAITKACEAASH